MEQKTVNKKQRTKKQRELYLKLAKKLLGDKCVKCGDSTKLHIHHKDHNPENSDLTNLELLCASCHAIHHHPKKIKISQRGLLGKRKPLGAQPKQGYKKKTLSISNQAAQILEQKEKEGKHGDQGKIVSQLIIEKYTSQEATTQNGK
jgi:hypothetical protein